MAGECYDHCDEVLGAEGLTWEWGMDLILNREAELNGECSLLVFDRAYLEVVGAASDECPGPVVKEIETPRNIIDCLLGRTRTTTGYECPMAKIIRERTTVEYARLELAGGLTL